MAGKTAFCENDSQVINVSVSPQRMQAHSAPVFSTKIVSKYFLLQHRSDIHSVCCIVGAGSAGSVLARRLTEDVDVTVAVLEAGDDETSNWAAIVPIAHFLLQNTAADWAYRTVPQKTSSFGVKNRARALISFSVRRSFL